jgi:hypothetical protein
MSDSISVKCPSCHHEFPLNDAVLGSVRDHLSQELSATIEKKAMARASEAKAVELQDLREALSEKADALAKAREAELDLRKQRQKLEADRENLDLETQRKLDAEREKLKEQIARQEAERLAHEKTALQEQILAARKESEKAGEAHARQLRELQASLAEQSAALKKAREDELALRKERRKLETDRENLELETQRQLDAEREKLKEQIAKQEAERAAQRQGELEKKLRDALKANEDLHRKLEQGSQQTQGEVLELEIENTLRSTFPLDHFEEVPKGIRGADLIQHVSNPLGQRSGTIVYETKQTKSWSRDWVPKLKDDLAKVKGDVGVLITATLPDGIGTFGQINGVWVCSVTHALPLVHTLRWSLIELSRAKAASAGMEDNKSLLYNYFTGPEFRNRLETIVTTFDNMRTTLEAERKALTKHWAAREKQIEKVVLHLTGMQGDVQGIAGTSSLNELDTLALGEE